MVYYLIVCRSLTYAQRTARVLEQSGITAIVIRTPRWIPSQGCGYCVKISERQLNNALYALKKVGLGYSSVYLLNENGIGSEVTWDDIP